MTLKRDQELLVGTWSMVMDVGQDGRVAIWLTHTPHPYRKGRRVMVKSHAISELPETDLQVVSWYDLVDHCAWALWHKKP
jgi:hypothetical protein